jgi:hypothetical protein
MSLTNLAAMPRMAEKAAEALARPGRNVTEGLRAIEAWFTQNGDPFAGLAPPGFVEALHHHQDILDQTSEALSNAELVARLCSTFATLSNRLARARKQED